MFLSIIYPSATATAIAKPCVVAAVDCEVPSAKVNELELNVTPAKVLVPENVLLPLKVIFAVASKVTAFSATIASTTSVEDAIVPVSYTHLTLPTNREV